MYKHILTFSVLLLVDLLPNGQELDIENFEYTYGPCLYIGKKQNTQGKHYLYQKCFDVNACASKSNRDGRFAIVLSHTLERIPENGRFKPESLRSFLSFQEENVDLVILVPKCPPSNLHKRDRVYCTGIENDRKVAVYKPQAQWGGRENINISMDKIVTFGKPVGGFFPLTTEERNLIEKHQIKVVEVPWILPPGVSEGVGGCALKDLIRLHAFSLVQYDAVVYFDTDVILVDDIMPLFRCAATDEFIMTEGKAGTPLNAGFMALKPNKDLLEMSMWFAERAEFVMHPKLFLEGKGAWADGGTWPSTSGSPFVGLECGQGFLWTLIYGNGLGKEHATSQLARDAHKRFPNALRKEGRMASRCIYNHQNEGYRDCGQNFTCDMLVAHHKEFKYGQRAARQASGDLMCLKPNCSLKADLMKRACKPLAGYPPASKNKMLSQGNNIFLQLLALPRPKVFVYELPDEFRENKRRNQIEANAVFGRRAPRSVNGATIYYSNPDDWPWMVYKRLLSSKFRSKTIDDADIFFVPGWNDENCDMPTSRSLLNVMFAQNPKLKKQLQIGNRKISRHIIPSLSICESEGKVPFYSMSTNTKASSSIAEFNLPTPTLYHGPFSSSPILKKNVEARFLWSLSKIDNDADADFEQKMGKICKSSRNCHPHFHIQQTDSTSPALVDMSLKSTFCVHGPKNVRTIIDTLLLGCIPVLFNETQLSLWESHLSPSEMLSASVYLPDHRLDSIPNSLEEKLVNSLSFQNIAVIYMFLFQEVVTEKLENIKSLIPRLILRDEEDELDSLDILLRYMVFTQPRE
eukprot:m.222855 g.222855  ORF g.222855 m.222855 type:complete len:804 (+) comp15940_c2_seq6:84-2495(+)